jgi:hypothetical protein
MGQPTGEFLTNLRMSTIKESVELLQGTKDEGGGIASTLISVVSMFNHHASVMIVAPLACEKSDA